MKISITLPSLHPNLTKRAVENINSATRSPVEILVVGPFHARGPNVVWIPEEKPAGVAAAQHLASTHATGDFVAASADDYDFFDGWDEIAIQEFLEGESTCGADNYVLGMRYAVGNLAGTVFGLYYPNFPMMRTSSLKKFGWVSPDYRRGFGDCDLGMRVWDSGGVCEFSTFEILKPVRGQSGRTLDDERKSALYADEDMSLFVSRWAGKYGKGWDTSYLRGFNLDIDIVKYRHALTTTGRSIIFNSPRFVELVAGSQLNLRTS